MLDIATTWDNANFQGAWSITAGDLASDDSLRTPVLISLMTDRLANADDELPDNSGNRRGWWADKPLPGEDQDLIGSRLWLLSRAKATKATAQRARDYCLEALQWLIDRGIAAAVDVATTWISDTALGIVVTISRISRAGDAVNHVYDLTWDASLA